MAAMKRLLCCCVGQTDVAGINILPKKKALDKAVKAEQAKQASATHKHIKGGEQDRHGNENATKKAVAPPDVVPPQDPDISCSPNSKAAEDNGGSGDNGENGSNIGNDGNGDNRDNEIGENADNSYSGDNRDKGVNGVSEMNNRCDEVAEEPGQKTVRVELSMQVQKPSADEKHEDTVTTEGVDEKPGEAGMAQSTDAKQVEDTADPAAHKYDEYLVQEQTATFLTLDVTPMTITPPATDTFDNHKSSLDQFDAPRKRDRRSGGRSLYVLKKTSPDTQTPHTAVENPSDETASSPHVDKVLLLHTKGPSDSSRSGSSSSSSSSSSSHSSHAGDSDEEQKTDKLKES